MKIKLTPDLSYLVGLWRKRRSAEGLGVVGNEEFLELFTAEVLEKELTTTDKLLTEENKVYFYHSAYRKFFQQIEKEQMERFKYLNEYAANYLAGMFDAIGNVDTKGIVFLNSMTRQDQMMLLRLGFGTRKRGDSLILERPVVFLAFIKNFVKLTKEHKVFQYVKSR